MSGLKAILSEVGVTNPERLKDNVKIAGYEKKTVGLFGYLVYGTFGLAEYSVYSNL